MANFRARARTVDLLGRQQIAGIPTAISELFKNAHDAYAERVDVDFVREDQLFVLRDDGVGMTGDTFADRWLVLGTESKVRGQASRPRPRPGFLERPVLGEKGIGRLAIASIGPALLVLTRPLADSEDPTPVYAAFLHWGLFELPAINLDQIDIPVENLGAEVPDLQAVRKLVDAFAANLDALTDDADHDRVARIRRDLEAFEVDPRTRERELGGPSLARDGHGTHFYVKPADDSLAAGIDEHRDDRATDVVATLIGFSETMLPDSPAPTIATHFRDHRNGVEEDLLSPGAFFTPEEFERADHRIEGGFAVDGTFEGTVSVYGQDPVAYRLSWPGAGGKDLDCGAFDLNLALVQPDVAESRMSGSDLAALRRKMIKLGGLYVYRDRIRILPYGRPENDWLDIEQERSKHAGRAFLSHRRMFGEVSLTSDHNRGLEEKAGREGFGDNRAYRQFRDLLRHFLYTGIVADFFLEGGVYSATKNVSLEYKLLDGSAGKVPARIGCLGAARFVELFGKLKWHPEYDVVIAPFKRFLNRATADGAITEWAVVWPQPANSPNTIDIPELGGLVPVVKRNRRIERIDFVGSDRKHSSAAVPIAKAENVDGLDGVAGRGAVLVYLADDRGDAAVTLSADNVVPLLSIAAPRSATPHKRDLVQWVVRSQSQPDEATVEIAPPQ